MTSASDALGPELIAALGTLRSIDAVRWDMLGEYLAIRAHAGPVGPRLAPVTWLVPRELVAELHSRLGEALSEIDNAELPRQ